MEVVSTVRTPLVTGQKTVHDVSEDICHYVEAKPNKLWMFGIILSLGALGFGGYCVFRTLWDGIGVWGLNKTVGWAWDITNFVWWVGIGHAGTLISAILLLFRQKWRMSINRAAEAMTIFAVICAAQFPLLHMGRLWLGFYWALPLPNTFGSLWVNFNSPLLWDVFAISTYFTVSLVFWYIGLIPDFATIRDRATGMRRSIYGALSFGWTGGAKDWNRYETVALVLAGLATPLVLSVHTIVSFDFATSVIPGWHTTIFPPYFVAGAIFSGFAMVLTLMIVTRKLFSLEDYITIYHIELMNIIIIVTGSIVGIAYITEFFIAWYSGVEAESYAFLNRATGPYWWAYASMMSCNVISPQLFWVKKIRTNIIATFTLSIIVNIGMWFERFVIIVTSLHRDFLPSSWAMFYPTMYDVGVYLFTFGVFFFFFLLFAKFFPVINMAEVKSIIKANSKNINMETKKNYLVGIFDDSEKVLHGISHVREQGVKIEEVFTPYPVHGIEAKLGYKRSKLSVAAFMFGALGTSLAILMQVWMLGIDWPMIIGGKNFVSAPTFVPVTFELTVLIGSLGMVGTFFVLSDLKPHKTPRIFDLRSTDDKMVMAVDLAVNKLSENEIQSILQAAGASEVYRKDFE